MTASASRESEQVIEWQRPAPGAWAYRSSSDDYGFDLYQIQEDGDFFVGWILKEASASFIVETLNTPSKDC